MFGDQNCFTNTFQNINVIKMPCSFWRLREYEMKELNIPLLYLNDFYIGFRECSLEKLQEIIKNM